MNRRRLLSGIIAIGYALRARADSLGEASTTDFHSASKAFRLRLDPSGHKLKLTLSSRGNGLWYRQQWSTLFQAAMFPTIAFVTDDGQYAVILCGYVLQQRTGNALAIFGPSGKLVKAFDLKDLFPPHEFARLVRSVSGIPWVGTAKLDNSGPSLLIVTNDPFPAPPPGSVYGSPPLVVTLRIALPTGTVARE